MGAVNIEVEAEDSQRVQNSQGGSDLGAHFAEKEKRSSKSGGACVTAQGLQTNS